ncbi:MAG: hypothetical protein V3U57_08980 [Robiginitomaculum sp.]
MVKLQKKVAILASENMLPGSETARDDIFELEEQMGKLRPAFAARGMELDLVNWREAPRLADEYDAMLPLLVWDYFEENEVKFLQFMAQISQKTNLFNPFDVIQWNANKAYLEELSGLGAPTIPSIFVDHATQKNVLRAMDKFGSDTVVIKPEIGGGAWRQALYARGEPFPARSELPPKGALIQPFLDRVKDEGEYSFLYFGGQFSHALVKIPKKGDYRVQSMYGSSEKTYEPTQGEREQARAVLDVLTFTPLYARVDLLRGNQGQLLLIELEMIEPYLYLLHAKGSGGDNKGAQNLAKALAKKLGL